MPLVATDAITVHEVTGEGVLADGETKVQMTQSVTKVPGDTVDLETLADYQQKAYKSGEGPLAECLREMDDKELEKVVEARDEAARSEATGGTVPQPEGEAKVTKTAANPTA
jgi:hypothetical protein